MPNFVTLNKEDPMGTLCRMVAETQYEDLPSSAINVAKTHILDTVGVIIGGSGLEGIPTVVDFVREQGGKEESLIPCYGGRKVPASMAAFAIGPMARAMDWGDVHEESGHTAEFTLPALLAATGIEGRVSGKEFITAFVVGQEILIRVGIAQKFARKAVVSGTTGGHYIFGTVAAVGKLLGLNLEELGNAEGIARCMTQPHDLATWSPTTLMVRVHHGFLSQDAINACLLAKRGITGARQEVLAGPRGFLTQFSKWDTDPSALTKGLGQEWEMTHTMMKVYPACMNIQCSAYGIVEQMREHKFKFEDIANIHLDEAPMNMSTVATPHDIRWNPQTMPECQFSLPYLVATAARDGKVSLDSYTSDAMSRKDVRDLMTRILAKEDTTLAISMWGSRVTTTLRDGTKYSEEYIPKGHYKDPFTDHELVNKFKTCASYSAYRLSDATIKSLVETILNLEEVDDIVSALIIPITPK